MYTVSQKNCAIFLRPITLEILNRSLPNSGTADRTALFTIRTSRHLGKISNGHISATGRPIHFMFCSKVGFSGTADLMALFSIRINSRWRPLTSWIISNGHISATAHDLLM